MTADPVNERRANHANQSHDRPELAAHDRAFDADVAHAPRTFLEATGFQRCAPKQLDQQCAADIEGFLYHGVHLGVDVHCLTCDFA